MDVECKFKSQLAVGGREPTTTREGRIAEIKFSPQLRQPKNPQGECVLVTLLNVGGSKKKPLKGPEFSPCEGCGREIAVVVSNTKR